MDRPVASSIGNMTRQECPKKEKKILKKIGFTGLINIHDIFPTLYV